MCYMFSSICNIPYKVIIRSMYQLFYFIMTHVERYLITFRLTDFNVKNYHTSYRPLPQQTKVQKENLELLVTQNQSGDTIILRIFYVYHHCSYVFLFILLSISNVQSASVSRHLFLQAKHPYFFLFKKNQATCFLSSLQFLVVFKKKKKEEISYVILTIKLCDFKSTCWILCTAELVSVSSPTMTALNSVMGSCLGSVKSTYSSDSESSGSAGTLCFFLGWRDGRLGLSWDMPSFSRVRVGWGPRWKHFMIESHKLKCFLSQWN